MNERFRTQMIFHGVIVILLGLAAGFPFAFVILGNIPGDYRAWRMAHLEGLLNGLLVIVIAAAGDRLVLDERKQLWLARSLVFMAYANVVAATLGATFGVRGLEPALPLSNVLVYALFMLAIAGVVVGLVLAAYGARTGSRGSSGRG